MGDFHTEKTRLSQSSKLIFKLHLQLDYDNQVFFVNQSFTTLGTVLVPTKADHDKG